MAASYTGGKIMRHEEVKSHKITLVLISDSAQRTEKEKRKAHIKSLLSLLADIQ